MALINGIVKRISPLDGSGNRIAPALKPAFGLLLKAKGFGQKTRALAT